MVLMYCSGALPKAIKEGLELLNLALWIWYFPKMINKLIRYISLFFTFVVMETKQYIFPQQRKIRDKFISNVSGYIFPESGGVGTLPEQVHHCFCAYSTYRTVNTYVMLKPEEILLSRLIPMHDFEREFSYFIRKEVFVRKIQIFPQFKLSTKLDQ